MSQAAANVNCVKSYQDTVNSNYFFFTNSPVRYNNLRAIYDILENEKFVTLKQSHPVRWLSLDQAVSAIFQRWPALVVVLSREANNGNSTANGLLRKMETFIAITCMLSDILPLFTRMSDISKRKLEFCKCFRNCEGNTNYHGTRCRQQQPANTGKPRSCTK